MTKSRTVKSPAGEPIQITTDEDWVEAVGAEVHSLRQWAGGSKPFILRALWEHGEFTDKSGRVGVAVQHYIRDHFPHADIPDKPASIMATFRNPVNYPAVISKMNGKRTFSLKLVAMPETWHRKLLQDIGPGKPGSNGDQAQEAPEAIPEPSQGDREAAALMEKVILPQPDEAQVTNWTDSDWEALQLDAPTVYEEPPPLEIHIANQVALSLLTTVVEIISSGSADTSQLGSARKLAQELETSQHLLSQRLMENDKLRRQLREAGDSITALRTERDGLRTRLRMTEHNLTEVLKGETAQAVNSEIQKRVDQFMRTPPTPKGD